MTPTMPLDDPAVPVRRPAGRSLDIVLDRTPVRKLEFVDIDPTPIRQPRRRATSSDSATAADGAVSDAIELTAPSSIDAGEPRWSLWSDAEV